MREVGEEDSTFGCGGEVGAVGLLSGAQWYERFDKAHEITHVLSNIRMPLLTLDRPHLDPAILLHIKTKIFIQIPGCRTCGLSLRISGLFSLYLR